LVHRRLAVYGTSVHLDLAIRAVRVRLASAA